MRPQFFEAYTAILREELVLALGCTEPSAVAFTAAKARELLGCVPEHITVQCSGNIIKNVKSVTVPATHGMRGVDTSAVLGTLTGRSELGLEVLSAVTPAHLDQAKALLAQGICSVELSDSNCNLDIKVSLTAKEASAVAEVAGSHTHLVYLEKNGEVLLKEDADTPAGNGNLSLLNMADIFAYATQVPLDEAGPLVERQLEYNTKIAQEGLCGAYGMNVGACLLACYGQDIKIRARAMAAAGSDARMSGCMLPVIINSGSGNQGMTVSLPVAEYAKELGASPEMLDRALLLANLVAIYLKAGIGKLSAYCGAVGAACGAGAGIALLSGADYDTVSRTVTNTLANVSGIVCDGAKASCAAKIASAVDAAILGYNLAAHGKVFSPGDGLVAGDVDGTIRNIGRLGHDGMRETDIEILNMMLGQ